MKKLTSILIAAMLCLTVVLSGCAPAAKESGSPAKESADQETASTEAKDEEGANADAKQDGDAPLNVGIILTGAGKGDKSFNDSAIRGLDQAVKDFGITYKDITSKDPAEDAKSIEQMAGKYDLLIVIGFTFSEALEEAAAKYPDQKFMIIEHQYEEHMPNVQEVTWREHEGAFLVGVLGAGLSETGTISFIGPMDTAVIHGREGGFKAGAKAYNPDINVITGYTGNDSSAFNNPTKCKEITLASIAKGSDFILSVAALSGLGSFDAAEEKGVRVVSADTNYSFLKPGIIIGGLEKHVNKAVYKTIEDLLEDKFEAGHVSYGLEDGGVELTGLRELTPAEQELSGEALEKVEAAKKAIPDELIEEIEAYKQKIISGEIVVPDWMKDGRPADA